MAKYGSIGLATIFVLLAVVPIASSHTKNITVYGLVILDGPNANVIPVAGNPNNPINTTKFGTIFAFNVPLTEAMDPGSPPVGHARGVEVISSTDGACYLSSVYFEHGEYNGSTLELQGRLGVAGLGFEGELSVAGGSGSFRSATGYSPQRTVFLIPGTNNNIVKLDIYVKSDHHI